MTIEIEFGYRTDGDFSLMGNEYFKAEETDDYDYYCKKKFLSNDYRDDLFCMFAAREFVERLLVQTSISYTHYSIMEDIYNMIAPVIEFVNRNKVGNIQREMSGNYDGTFVKVSIQ